MTADMKIKAIAPWFGGKRTLAPEIVAEIGDHNAWWDICCGSLAVTFAKEPCSMETCVDLHGDLTNLAFCLQSGYLAKRLYQELESTLLSREVFLKSADVIRTQPPPAGADGPDWNRAYHYVLVSWFGRNGVAGTNNYNSNFCVRYTKNGGHAATRFLGVVDSLPWWHERLRSATILRENGFDVLKRIEDREGTVIYVDPPYIEKGAKYLHDFEASDHFVLAELLSRFKRTRVIVSYYYHPTLAELYPGWTMRRLKATKALVNQGMRDKEGSVDAPEVLLINGPSYVEKPAGGLF